VADTPLHPEGDDHQRARLAVLAAVGNGDAGLAFDVVSDLMAEGMPFESILFDVIAPLQAEVGRRWQQGDYRIAEEHAATGAVETLVALLAGSFSNPEDGRHVVVACAEGDTHSLPARMVAAHLLYLGWRVTYLGAGAPAADLGAYLRDLEPEALVLSCAIVTCLPGARASIAAAHDAGVPVLAGGRAFGDSPQRAQRLGADAWVEHPGAIDETLRTWHPDIAASERQAVTPTAELERLETGRLRIIAEAVEVARGAEGAAGLRLRADVQILFDALLGALLAEEPAVIRDFGTWHHSVAAPVRTGEATAGIVGALRSAVAPLAPTAAGYLDEALIAIELSG
jgi:MerR family transcriptional regulator, light-induced transcriptional regulator